MTAQDDRSRWFTGGLTVDSVFTSGYWLVPAHVAFKGNKLHWRWERGTRSRFHVRSTKALLLNFLRIDSPQGVMKFAKRWGILAICDHGKPHSHHPAPVSWPAGKPIPCCQPSGYVRSKYRGGVEPVQAWVRFIKEFKDILDLARMIEASIEKTINEKEDHGVVPFNADWLFLRGDELKSLPPQIQEMVLTGRMNQLIRLAGVCPHFVSTKPCPEIRFQSSPPFGLFGALVAQLMFAVTKVDAVAFCSECAKPYMPLRRPRADQRQYCPDCRKTGAPQRQASRVYRQSRSRSVSKRRPSDR